MRVILDELKVGSFEKLVTSGELTNVVVASMTALSKKLYIVLGLSKLVNLSGVCGKKLFSGSGSI